MSEAGYPTAVSEVLATLADIYRHQGRKEMLELFEAARAHFDEIDYDKWNGGTTTWAFRLEIPVPIFAIIEPKLSEAEQEIEQKLKYLDRLHLNDPIGEVSITPTAPGTPTLASRMSPPEIEVRRLWGEDQFRLFLSHVSKHKDVASKLKEELRLNGVSAFVAHEDIEPSMEWRQEIELGLRSMHALAALLTPDFHDSLWTDQEIGWALGHGVLVVPVNLGKDPYGFAGKFQGASGYLARPPELALSIVKALMNNPQTRGEMHRSLVKAFSEVDSLHAAQQLCSLIIDVKGISEEMKRGLWKACVENKTLADANEVRAAIYGVFGKPPAPEKKEQENELPF